MDPSVKKSKIKSEFTIILALTVASAVMAFNLKSFIQTGELFPGGFSGVAVLLQRIFQTYLHLDVPYSFFYLPLNAIPAYVGFKFVGTKFTIYSFYVVILSSVLTDLLPHIPITYDTLLISIFGGIINGVAVSICLKFEASAGGTDIISIFFSEKKGIDAWNYIFAANVIILGTAGVLFGFDKALYSIIFQYTVTQVIQMMFKRYQKDTLLIITSTPEAVYYKIKELTNHDATLIDGKGCYEGTTRHILYSVVGREEVDKLIKAVKEVDPGAFINIINTEQIEGRFYRRPTR